MTESVHAPCVVPRAKELYKSTVRFTLTAYYSSAFQIRDHLIRNKFSRPRLIREITFECGFIFLGVARML